MDVLDRHRFDLTGGLGLQCPDDVAVGWTEASKSVLSWPTVPSCNFCRLVSTLSLVMLISTPVPVDRGPHGRGLMGAFGDVAAVVDPGQRQSAAAATQISPNSADTTPCREKVVCFTAGAPASWASRAWR